MGGLFVKLALPQADEREEADKQQKITNATAQLLSLSDLSCRVCQMHHPDGSR